MRILPLPHSRNPRWELFVAAWEEMHIIKACVGGDQPLVRLTVVDDKAIRSNPRPVWATARQGT
jgi:hypothetical protein